ncbi:unnamed protein product [Triticum turgidum subsp. durum]|uniref:RRM domain-containing protein n=1 Tax=Triticum turgidum subsp. durum TaxID=4567 RepID=A0A9R0TWG7_TRITD|nr:unnamed protein product [Triticum turgidum subsp. durum]
MRVSVGGSAGAVFYADKYHPIQAGSIDGTDVAPHDNAVLRALLCSTAGLYDPFGDPKAAGDPYCTVFVGHLSRLTDDDTVRKAMGRYGKVKSMRLVRDIVTGASRGYAFVEYETDKEMRRAYEENYSRMHTIPIDGSEVIVDYYRQQLMPGWIPRRLGGGLGGKKESGQLRFGGRERPFRAPLRPIPYDELKKLGIPPPPEGRYMTRFEVPPPPRRKGGNVDREESPPPRRISKDRADSTYRRQRSPTEDESSPRRRKSSHDHREESQRRMRSSREASTYSRQRSPTGDGGDHHKQKGHREQGDISSYDRHVSPAEDDGGHHRKRRRSREPGDIRRSHSRRRSPTEDDAGRRKRRKSRELGDTSSHSRHRSRAEYDGRGHHKRRKSREPGEVSPGTEDGSARRGGTSAEADHSPRHRSHREQRHHGGSSRSRHGDRARSRRSESRDYSQ